MIGGGAGARDSWRESTDSQTRPHHHCVIRIDPSLEEMRAHPSRTTERPTAVDLSQGSPAFSIGGQAGQGA
jgi:hypothetical protein